jgi:hypothetical protein
MKAFFPEMILQALIPESQDLVVLMMGLFEDFLLS